MDRLFVGVPEHLEKRLAQHWWNNMNAYCLTISPPPRNEDDEVISDHALRDIMRGYNYWLVAERDENNRLHYHGCIKLPRDKEVCNWIKNNLQTNVSKIGFTKLSQKPGKKWIEYCFKCYDKQVMDVIFNHIP